jgi:hypothetical protein
VHANLVGDHLHNLLVHRQSQEFGHSHKPFAPHDDGAVGAVFKQLQR